VAPDELHDHLFVCRPHRADVRTRLREVLELDDDKRGERAANALECLRAQLDWRVLSVRYADLYREVLQTEPR